MTLPAYAMNTSSFPEMYERHLVEPLFRPWAEILLERVAPAPGDRVLDIACGTGIVARLASDRLTPEATVVGVDLSAQMLDVARRTAPGIDWREGNAEALPVVSGETFTVVVCQQGLQFVQDRQRAVREMRRVTAPGGRLGVSTWRALNETPFFEVLQRVAERHLGTVVDQRHAFGDAVALEALLTDAGFRDVRVERMTRTLRFPDTTLVRMNTMALIGMSRAGTSLDDEDRARLVATIVAESESALAPFTDGDGLTFDIASNVATGRG